MANPPDDFRTMPTSMLIVRLVAGASSPEDAEDIADEIDRRIPPPYWDISFQRWCYSEPVR